MDNSTTWKAVLSPHLSAEEFCGREPTFTIAKFERVSVFDEKKNKEVEKLTVFFKEMERDWIPCKTTSLCLQAMFGPTLGHCIGKRVTLYADPDVKFGSARKLGIRVRGSPDLKAPVDVEIKFAKKALVVLRMEVTSQRSAPTSAPEPAGREPGVD